MADGYSIVCLLGDAAPVGELARALAADAGYTHIDGTERLRNVELLRNAAACLVTSSASPPNMELDCDRLPPAEAPFEDSTKLSVVFTVTEMCHRVRLALRTFSGGAWLDDGFYVDRVVRAVATPVRSSRLLLEISRTFGQVVKALSLCLRRESMLAAGSLAGMSFQRDYVVTNIGAGGVHHLREHYCLNLFVVKVCRHGPTPADRRNLTLSLFLKAGPQLAAEFRDRVPEMVKTRRRNDAREERKRLGEWQLERYRRRLGAW
jgi:hypothetical protein